MINQITLSRTTTSQLQSSDQIKTQTAAETNIQSTDNNSNDKRIESLTHSIASISEAAEIAKFSHNKRMSLSLTMKNSASILCLKPNDMVGQAASTFFAHSHK